MKKGLSLILAIAMVFSMFASVAMANELTVEQKFEALKEKKIFSGFEDGSAGLDKSMTRAQVSVVVAKLLNLTEDKAAASVFKDLKGAEWAAGYIGAAVKADLMVGTGGGKFNPSGKFTTEQLAVVMVKAQKLAVSDEAVEGKVSTWAKGYVAAAIKAGLIAKGTDYTAPALRSVLVETTFAVDQLIQAGDKLTVAVKQTAAKELTLTFNKAAAADAKVTVKSTYLTVDGKAEFAADRKSAVFTVDANENFPAGDYTVEVTGAAVVKATVEAPKLTSLKWTQTGLQAIAGNVVKYEGVDQFGKKMATSGAVVTAFNTTSNTKLGTSGEKDGEFTIDNLLKKDDSVLLYVTVGAIQIQETVKVAAASVVSSVKIGEMKPLEKSKRITEGDKDLVLPVTLVDQYGKDMTLNNANMANVVFVSSATTVMSTTYTYATDKDNKVIGLKLDAGVPGKATLSLIVPATATQASATIEVFKKAEFTTLALTQPTGTFYANEEIKVSYEAKDQYGDAWELKDNAAFASVTFVSSNPTVLTATYNVVEGKLVIKPIAEGTATLSFYKGASNGSLTFNVNKAATLSKIKGLADGTVTRFTYQSFKTYGVGDFVVLDSYSREVNKDHPNAALKAELAAATVKVEAKTASDKKVAFKDGVANTVYGTEDFGTQTLKVAINSLTNEFVAASVDTNDVVKYEMDVPAITTLLKQGTTGFTDAHRVTFKIKHGLDKDGNKVAVTEGFDSVTSSNQAVIHATTATGTVYAADKGEAVVLIYKYGKEVAAITLKGSDEAPVQTALSFNDKVEKEVKVGTKLVLADNLVVKDQYGVEIGKTGIWTVTNQKLLTPVENEAGSFDAKAEGEVTVTFIANAKTVRTTIVIKK